MEPAVDPFQPLLRVLDRYKQDVHELAAPAPPGSVDRASAHLGRPVPPTLLAFLTRWDGAVLFRGALRVRAVEALAPADRAAADVVIFADGPLPLDHWAYAPDGQGEVVFGRWHRANTERGGVSGAFEPLHERFDRWLFATIRILDEGITDPVDRHKARLHGDPDCGHLLLAEAERVLADGDPDSARDLLRRATAAEPSLVAAWERLGDAMMGDDKATARWAYLKALRALRLPAPYPTTAAPGPGLLRTLARLFPVGDEAWINELRRFLDENVRDAASWSELALVEAAVTTLARALLERGDRRGAHAVISGALERARAFQAHGPWAEAVLLIAALETDLGLHNEAERHLRVLRYEPPPVAARATLALGRLAVARQEPWAEEILESARPHLLDPVDRCEVDVLFGERSLLRAEPQAARRYFEEAARQAERVGSPAMAARAALGLCDVFRQADDGPTAEGHLRRAREAAGDDRELLCRVLLRRGDLYRMAGEVELATADYHQAATGFADLGLTIREAWAWLRLAQVGQAGAVDQALARFRAVDLAAGVAAADAISGNPNRSLDWHLDRSAEHARDRANAQRARPPLVRADADRPERRLGAHRMAIAAGDRRVVGWLRAEMDQRVRSADLSAARVSDPNLARYVAAADLLAGHRSYDAAEALLEHMVEAAPCGLAGRALAGALARSPNAALVSGLLEILEAGRDPTAMATAAEVLGLRREAAALDVLRVLASSNSHRSARRAAIVAIGRVGDPVAAEDLLPALDSPDLAEETSIALLLLGDITGVDYQAQELASRASAAGRFAGEIVGRFGGSSYLLLLLGLVGDEGPAGLGALQGLGYLGDPRAVPLLIDATASRDSQRARVASTALEILTGHHEDAEESLLRSRWAQWWDTKSADLQSGRRYRLGHLFEPGQLVARLSHDDALVRRSTYDELVISTGKRLPFDAEGPYRVQVAHQAVWAAWWRIASETWPVGRWSFHGEVLA